MTARLDDPTIVLVDARTRAEHIDGDIPGAINLPCADNAMADDPKVFTLVNPYCSTGVRSATTYFTLGLTGYPPSGAADLGREEAVAAIEVRLFVRAANIDSGDLMERQNLHQRLGEGSAHESLNP